MSVPVREWTPSSWRKLKISQQPDYEDKAKAAKVLQTIQNLPPLVHPHEVEALKEQLAQAARGERFLLQGGDCAERFADCSAAPIEAKLKILLQMSLILTWGARLQTVRIGRVAGQYGKPRSSPYETVDGTKLHSFKGDNINGFEATPESRAHDPERLLQAHFHSASTLNYIRALIQGGIAGLTQAQEWDLGFVAEKTQREAYEDISKRIVESLDFMKSCGAISNEALNRVDFFTSHEGLVLEYENAVTRPVGEKYYNLGAHFLWIGDRTRQLTDAHVEYFRGIANPIGCKVGPTMEPQELVDLLRILNPNNEEGKITLITRFGYNKVHKRLPYHIKAVQDAGLNVVWTCDPMHGNTYKTDNSVKTRSFAHILEELTTTFDMHVRMGSILAGVHFELTGEDVTECVGGPQNLEAGDLHLRYTSYCDPRLNYAQSMEMAFLLAKRLEASRRSSKPASEDPYKKYRTRSKL